MKTFRLDKYRLLENGNVIKVIDCEQRLHPFQSEIGMKVNKLPLMKTKEAVYGDLKVIIGGSGIKILDLGTNEELCFFNRMGMFALTEFLNENYHYQTLTFSSNEQDGILVEDLLEILKMK